MSQESENRLSQKTLPPLPSEPGCYLFRNGQGKVIYVGKAKDLKKRVLSYFRKSGLDVKTGAMLRNAASLDFVVTDSEVEALLLENNLIKKHNPRYNIKLRDAKRYALIRITNEKYPRLIIARRRLGGGRFFGPFVSAVDRDYILATLRKIFRIRTCKRMPKRACLRHHLQLCEAPCIGEQSQDDYLRGVEGAEMVLKGKTQELILGMTEKMNLASKDLNFEYALELRNRLRSLEWLAERQKMDRERHYDQDVMAYLIREGRVYLLLFHVHKGTLEGKQEFSFDYHENFVEDFLVQFYSENPIPAEIILPQEMDEVLMEFLSREKGSNVRARVPKRGEKKKLLELAEKNVELSFFGDEEKLEALKKALRLQNPPRVMECFDISHLSGTLTVGSMVQFRNARPDKSNYRRFRIRTVEGIDDFAAMAEVVKRRYRRRLEEHSPMPDLIVIDGGKGQLSAAQKELEKLGLKIPLLSLAKREEEVFVPGIALPFILDKKGKALLLLQQIRNEAHRFAIKYNRLLRSKELRE